MEQVRLKEREPAQEADSETETVAAYAALREQASTGKVVIRAKELPWLESSMGYLKSFFSWKGDSDAALADWTCFINDIRVHSGKHRHQGGIMLFILEGEGYTVVDGEKYEWKKGDLIVLPVKPNGCEHQHFNKEPGKPAKWMAFRYHPFSKLLGGVYEHVEDAPEWKSNHQ